MRSAPLVRTPFVCCRRLSLSDPLFNVQVGLFITPYDWYDHTLLRQWVPALLQRIAVLQKGVAFGCGLWAHTQEVTRPLKAYMKSLCAATHHTAFSECC